MIKKRGQVSVEYLVVVGFVTMVVIGILGVAIVFSGTIRDRIRITQIDNFANKVISVSESVFYAGEPSKATVFGELPEGVTDIEISENSLIVSVSTDTGQNKLMYVSKVPMQGSISPGGGTKKVSVVANEDYVEISPA